MLSDRHAAPPWYAIWTRSRHEQVVRDQLQRKGYEAFLPTITKWSRWKDRKKKVDWPLFPGYCFARFDGRDVSRFSSAPASSASSRSTARLRRFPSSRSTASAGSVESELQFDPCPLIREGMMVEVVHGPLKGVVGRLMRKGAHARLMLAVDLIGQAVSVEVDAADVKPNDVQRTSATCDTQCTCDR